MSRHQAFRRQPMPQEFAQALQPTTLPAPTRGIIESENDAFMAPGGAIIQDNWFPTMKGCKLRGGCIRWCVLPETTPIISGFEYASGNVQRMYAANASKLYDVTTATPTLIKSGQGSGNYAAAQLNPATTDFMIAVNDFGDKPLRYNGTTWITLDPPAVPSDGASAITGPVGSPVEFGRNLTYIWKYRSRLFFIEANSMNAWCLPLNAVGGTLAKIPLSGAATKGGKLLFGATWSIDAGDGIDDKCVFVTDLGEVIIFTGNDPTLSTAWKQEGRYQIAPPMGMNAWTQVGGDLLIATVDGIVPISQALQKTAGQLELAMITRNIKRMWRDEVLLKRAYPWTIKQWPEIGGIFVTWPYGEPGKRLCAAVNNATGAWARVVGWDATCFLMMRGDMFFGTQGGIVMQANRSGMDDGAPYVATLVGGWEMFGAPSATFVWHQARAVFAAAANQPFEPQLTATVDFVVNVPPPPNPGLDPGPLEVWDQGLWDQARWDQPSAPRAPNRNTMWVSIGQTGFAHAPIVQVTVQQQATPDVELLAISATFERAGVNV